MKFPTHHLGLTPEFAQDVTVWLVSGEAERTMALYALLDVQEGTQVTGRQLPICRGKIIRNLSPGETKKQEITVGLATSGMGMSSLEITSLEIAETYFQLMQDLVEASQEADGNKPLNLIRTGTSGSHQPDVYGGDVVIARDTYTVFGAVDDLIETNQDNPQYHHRLERLLAAEEILSKHNGFFPTVFKRQREQLLAEINEKIAREEIVKVHPCDQKIVSYIQHAAERLPAEGFAYHTGGVFSKLTLFSELVDSFKLKPEGKRAKRLETRGKVLREMGILASEMEIAMLTSIAHLAKLEGYDIRVGGIMGVVNNPRRTEVSGSLEHSLFGDRSVYDTAVKRVLCLGLETAVEIYRAEQK